MVNVTVLDLHGGQDQQNGQVDLNDIEKVSEQEFDRHIKTLNI